MQPAQSLSALEGALKGHFPGDVLCSVRAGTKQPDHCHRGGSWRWEDWEKVRICCAAGRKRLDVCIILQGLAVIDVDTEEQALALEAKFPILTACPMVRAH